MIIKSNQAVVYIYITIICRYRGGLIYIFFSTRHMLWRRLRTAPDKWLPGPEARHRSLTRCCVRSSLDFAVAAVALRLVRRKTFRQNPTGSQARDPSTSAALNVALELGLPIAAHARPCESLPRCWSQVSVTHVHRCDVLSLGSFGPCL